FFYSLVSLYISRFVKKKLINEKLSLQLLQYEIGRIFVREIIPFMSSTKYIKPTESELEILQILWQRGLATVREVHEELSKSKNAGYTTTLKLMQIMHEKGLVRRDESMRTHVYQPAVNKEKTQRHLLEKMIDSLFGGSSTQLVLQALGENKTTPEELEQIQILLNNLKKK
ncbi:MAG: BlaI/MecI/CopY family transcriptional regulator, partial [Chitinophagaceae bacterium]